MTPQALAKMKRELWWLEYRQALQSEHWHDLKAIVRARCNGRCEMPGCSGAAEELHHLTYRDLANETPEQVRYLCSDCHEKIHRNTLL